MMQYKSLSIACFASILWWGTSCHTASYVLTSVQGGRSEITSVYDKNPDAKAVAILAPYKTKVDSLMSPIIGESEMDMIAARPESLLSNLVADILLQASEKYTGQKADVGLVNMGGLRASLPKGIVTYGDVYRILPFENTLCIVSMSGAQLKQLFENIASVKGEGISGAKMVISPEERKLISVEVGGQPIDENRSYRVSTIDYLAEGNDCMSALKDATDKVMPKGATLRQLMLDYVADLHKQGKKVTSRLEGRVINK